MTPEAERQDASPTLHLHLTRRRSVRWSHDTHDNEHEGKKSSKSCCIFQKKRAWDESSTESDEERGDGDGDGGESDGSSSSGGPGEFIERRRRVEPYQSNGGRDGAEASADGRV